MDQTEPTSDPTAGTRFPCSQCGAMLQFAPGTESLVCEHCGTVNEIAPATDHVEELDFHATIAQLEASAELEERQVIKCDACGAEVDPPRHVTATDCPYCGFHLNVTLLTERVIKPQCVLPFKVTRGEAEHAFFQWLRSRWFAPNRLKRYARKESRLSGMYVPAWTYDADTFSRYTGQRGDDYYVTVGSGKNRRRVRRTRWRYVSGHVTLDFDDVLVLATHSLPAKHAHALEPWDLANLVNYADEYIAGFQAECYQIDLPQGFDLARGIMDARIRTAIAHDIGGDHQRIHSVNTTYDNITYKHIMLPVWISAYRFHNKVYRFLVNARTGEVQGERPYSWIKITLASLAAVIVGLVVAYFAAQN